MEINEHELALYDILHHPALFMQFVTPVDERAVKTLPFGDWMEADHWGRVRLYQYPPLPWDHPLPDDVPIKSTQGIDRSVGSAYDFGGRSTSKSFTLVHDPLQAALIRPGETTIVTSRDDNHLSARIDTIWSYADRHPLFRPLHLRTKKGDPYATIDWWNGHVTQGIYESTSGEGDSYLGKKAHRLDVDEFQLTSKKAWRKFFDANSEEGCVVRTTGVSDGRRDTPAHEVRNDPSLEPFVHRKPQFLNEIVWNPDRKREARDNYGGSEESQGYKTNIRAEEGDPTSSVWDIESILACTAIMPEDTRKKPENRRYMPCPVVSITGAEIKRGERLSSVDYPPVLDDEMEVYISVDVGKRQDPSVVDIWGIDSNQKPHLWGIVLMHHVDYIDQGEMLYDIIEHYACTCFGIDETGGGGHAVLERVHRLLPHKSQVAVIPVNFRRTVEVVDPTRPKRGRRGKYKETARLTSKLGVKYFTTMKLQSRFARRAVQLLYLSAMMVQFMSEVAKQTTSRYTTIIETYNAPRGDDFIDAMRILEYMLYVMAGRVATRSSSTQVSLRLVPLGRL